MASLPELLATADELGARFAKRAERHDREASFPFDDFDDLRAAGFLALCVPADHGGLGADFATYARVSRQVGRHAPATALAFNMHCVTMLVTGPIADDLTWTADEDAARRERRAALYRGVVEEGHLHAQPFSEGQSAGALAGYTTTAEPVDGGYLVTGRKIFASLADAADVHNVVAVSPGDPRIRLLGVTRDSPGLRIEGEWDPLGMRATSSRTLVMDRVFVPLEREWLPVGGFDQAATRWPHLYLTLSFTYLGLAVGVLDATRRYLLDSGRGHQPVKQHGWAAMQLAVERADALVLRAVDEAGVDPSPEQVRRAWAAVVTAMETAPEVSSTALRVCGGRSLLKPQPLERLYRDARCGATMLPWSVDVCLERLGRAGLDDGEEPPA
jgi:alkylation response protein AidB-like acyl-CoA dehydrogenase